MKGADKNAERQLRAYVMLKIARFNNTELGNYYIDVELMNWGSTPAHRCTITFESEVCEEKDRALEMLFSQKAETMHNLMFAPSHSHVLHLHRRDVSETNWSTPEFKRVAYVWGRIDYLDAFDKPRFTRFQLMHRFGEVKEFALCRVGNDAN